MKGDRIAGHACKMLGLTPEVDVPREVLSDILQRVYQEYVFDSNYDLVEIVSIDPSITQYDLPNYVGDVVDVYFKVGDEVLSSKRLNFETYLSYTEPNIILYSITTDQNSKVLLVKQAPSCSAVVVYRPVETVSLDLEIPLKSEFQTDLINGFVKYLGLHIIATTNNLDEGRLFALRYVIEFHSNEFEKGKTRYKRFLSRDKTAVVKPFRMF